MNIWHYIHPHYRYDIQEMKIVLAKQLLCSFLSSNYRVVSHSKYKEVLYPSVSALIRNSPPLEMFHIMGSRLESR